MFVIVSEMGRGRQRSSGGRRETGESFPIWKEESEEVIYQMFVWGSKIDLADTGEEVLVGF